MKNLACVTLSFLASLGMFSPILSAYAQDDSAAAVMEGGDVDEPVLSVGEAHSMVAALPTAKDAVTGEVQTDIGDEYYDIYGRQLGYVIGAKAFRSSLESRQASYATPKNTALEQYRSAIEKLYKAEAAAAKTAAEDEEQSESLNESDTETVEKIAGVDDASDDDVPEDVLKEEPIPAKDGDDGVNKKVITTKDAPDFDPANL